MNEETNVQVHIKYIKKIDEFISSMKSIYFFIIVITLVMVLQSILFLFNVISVNGHYITEATQHEKVMVWVSIGMALMSCYIGFITCICNIRQTNWFMFWMTVRLLFSVPVAIMSGALFSSITLVLAYLTGFVRYFWWTRELDKKLKHHNIITLVTGALSVTILFITFVTLVTLYGDSIYANFWNYDKQWTWYFDAIGASIEITGFVLLIFKSKWGYLFFIVSKFFVITVYAAGNNFIPMIQYVLFLSTDISGFLTWTFLKKGQEEAKATTD